MVTNRIYLDHAATTPCHAAVIKAMWPYFAEQYGNPSALHAEGRLSRQAIDGARDLAAETIAAEAPKEIIFTASGSEANNMAITGAARAARTAGRGDHVIVSQIEHESVLRAATQLANEGFRITKVTPGRDGIVAVEEIKKAITPNTALISLMMANNEIGTLQPVAQTAAICRERNIVMHTDAVQAAGMIPIDVEQLGVDLLSLSAHKFYGPKGVGLLYIRQGTPLTPLIHGGGQEMERRAGTESVAHIVGLARALQMAVQVQEEMAAKLTPLRDLLIEGVLDRVEGASLNGHRNMRLPGTAHFSFAGINGESLLLVLDMEGISVSTGSACSAGAVEPSYVLRAMGLSDDQATSGLRFTLGRDTTADEINRTIDVLGRVVARLR